MSIYKPSIASLTACLSSVLRQRNIDFSKVELVIILDGANDSILNFINDFLYSKINFIIKVKENSGLTKSLNYGLKFCSGKYIARIDCDDSWEETKLMKQLNILTSNENIKIIGSGWRVNDEYGEHLFCVKNKFSKEEIKYRLAEYNLFNHSSIIFDKDTITELGGYDERFLYAQDYFLWCKVLSLKKHHAHIINEILVNRTYQETSYLKKSKQLLTSVHSRMYLLVRGIFTFKSILFLLKSYFGSIYYMLLHNLNFKRISNLVSQSDYWHGKLYESSNFKSDEVSGYMRDFRAKFIENLSLDPRIFIKKVDVNGSEFIHPVTTAQTALGIYELYLDSGSDYYRNSFLSTVNYLIDSGEIENDYMFWKVPYSFKLFDQEEGFKSSLIQGQAISVLLRAFLLTNDKKFLQYSIKAFSFMHLEINNGGCRLMNSYTYEEYPSTKQQTVFNGLIYSIYAIYELWLITKDDFYLNIFRKSFSELEININKYDAEFWSRYSLKQNNFCYSNLASIYYHKEHILQLKALQKILPSNELKLYEKKWSNYLDNSVYKLLLYGNKLFFRLIQIILNQR